MKRDSRGAHTVITQQYTRRRNTPLLRNLQDRLLLHHRAPRASQRTVRGNVNVLLLAEIDNLLLW